MAPELGGSQISALLESVPGIARVLRSPVADAIVNMIRAGADLEPFNRTDADELLQFAIRRGLISTVEADQVQGEIKGIGGRKRPSKTTVKKSYPMAKKMSPFRKAVPAAAAKVAAAKVAAAKAAVAKAAPKPAPKAAVKKTAAPPTKSKPAAKKSAPKAVKKPVKKLVKKAAKKSTKKTTKKTPKRRR